jgi:hypothetical protein
LRCLAGGSGREPELLEFRAPGGSISIRCLWCPTYEVY